MMLSVFRANASTYFLWTRSGSYRYD